MNQLVDVGGRSIDPHAQLIDLDRTECEESLYEFLKQSWHINDSAPWVDGWCIEAIAEHLQAIIDGEIRRLIINIPPRCSKPVAHDSLISTLERGLIPLSEVFTGLHVLTHKGRFRRVTEIHRQGVIPTLKMTTRTGRTIVAASDHPFLTPLGWQELGNISSQDVVGTIPQYTPCGTKTVSLECARLLGYLVGDGHCKGTPNITVADDIEAADIRSCIRSLGFNYSDQSYHIANTGYLLRRIAIKSDGMDKMAGRTKKGFRGPVRKFMTEHGLDLHSSYTKLIPKCVMEGDDDIVKNFIGAYWACDGYVTTKGTKRDGTQRQDLVIGCDSVNKGFMDQMQIVLLRLGISSIVRKKISKIKTKKQGDEYTSYALVISDQDNCWRFATRITIHHTKGEKLEAAKKRRFDFDHIVRGEVVEEITAHGGTECMCLTVEEDESFVANGFAVHNSALCSIALCAWTWAQSKISHTSGPGVSFLYAAFKDNLVTRDSRKCRQVIESNWYKARWGDRFSILTDSNTKSRFTNDKGGERLTTSVEDKGATGEGADIIVLDDCNSAKQVESDAVIESTLDWLDGTMSTRFNNQKLGAMIEIQQRVGEKDVTGHILSKKRADWVHLCLPMEYEPERSFMTPLGWSDPRTQPGELLWPERFGPEEVAYLKEDLGEWRACGQLQQRPEPRGGGVIKRAYWKLWEGDKYPPMDFIIGCLDTAYTLDRINDPSGMIVWGVFTPDEIAQSHSIYDRITKKLVTVGPGKSGNAPHAMNMFAWTERYEFHELVEKTVQTARKMRIDLLLIENKAAGISVGQEIRRLYANERFSVQFFDPKSQDKFARLVSVQNIFQEGLVCSPDTAWAEAVITQVGQFPRGAHDEYVDMTSMGLRYLRDNGMLKRAIEHEIEMEAMKVYPGGREQPLYAV